MKIVHHQKFEKHYKQRIFNNPKLKEKFKAKLALFLSNPHDSSLKSHKLIGNKEEFRAFSVTGDIRLIYYFESDTGNVLVLYDIGKHNQVY